MTESIDVADAGLPASEMENVFRRAGILIESLNAAKSTQAKSTRLGTFLSQNVGRSVPVEINGRTGTATLRCIQRRSKSKRYLFEIRWDSPVAESSGPSGCPTGSPTPGSPSSPGAAPPTAPSPGQRTEAGAAEVISSNTICCDTVPNAAAAMTMNRNTNNTPTSGGDTSANDARATGTIKMEGNAETW